MTDLVKCDRCGTPFSIQTAGIRSTWSGDYMVQYFTCPGCHHRYQILTTDTELRQTVERHKKIAAKIRMGQSKHFRPGTLKKYQAEMEKLEAEQKKRRDELLDKGDEILARCFLHEIDHLDGHMYIEIAEKMLTPEELAALEQQEADNEEDEG